MFNRGIWFKKNTSLALISSLIFIYFFTCSCLALHQYSGRTCHSFSTLYEWGCGWSWVSINQIWSIKPETCRNQTWTFMHIKWRAALRGSPPLSNTDNWIRRAVIERLFPAVLTLPNSSEEKAVGFITRSLTAFTRRSGFPRSSGIQEHNSCILKYEKQSLIST